MPNSATQKQDEADTGQPPAVEVATSTVHPLRNEDRDEVLDFLAARPIHTVFMRSFIYDNGIESDLNRGVFYACRNAQGQLEGVALIGHATFIEAASAAAVEAFAHLAQDCPAAHMILGEHEMVAQFWTHFSQCGKTPRRVCREILFEQRWPIEVLDSISGLRLATPDDLDLILPVNAAMVLQESGVNPMETDPEGFTRRWLRRIRHQRVWVLVENGRLIFNTDIMCETPDVIYLEGIYVHPEERGKGYGLRCLSQLSRSLLERVQSLCLLSNEQNVGAHAFYQRVGFQPHGYYDSVFLHKKN